MIRKRFTYVLLAYFFLFSLSFPFNSIKAASNLTCTGLTFTQNGNTVTNVSTGSAQVQVTANITGNSGTLNYSNAVWSINVPDAVTQQNPNPDLTPYQVSNSSNYGILTPPSSLPQNSVDDIVQLTQISDNNGTANLSNCTGTLTLTASASTTSTPTSTPTSASGSSTQSSQSLPNTGNISFTIIGLIAGLALIIIPFFILRKKAQ